MFRKTLGAEKGVGLNVGKIAATETTLGSMKTENGKICSFVTEGKLTEDEIEKAFFGCGVVFEKRERNGGSVAELHVGGRVPAPRGDREGKLGAAR